MLPADKDSPVAYGDDILTEDGKAQHLYITSDEVTLIGDLVISRINQGLFTIEEGSIIDDICDKVIASTDPELGLPGIPSKFIELYVKAPIKEVEVGYNASDHAVVRVIAEDGEVTVFVEGEDDEIELENGSTISMRFKGGVNSGEPTLMLVPETGTSWDDVWDDFAESNEYKLCLARNLLPVYRKWVEENYYPPTKIEK